MLVSSALSRLLPRIVGVTHTSNRLVLSVCRGNSFRRFAGSSRAPIADTSLTTRGLVVRELARLAPSVPVLSRRSTSVTLTGQIR